MKQVARLKTAPILTVHLLYEGLAAPPDMVFTAYPGSPVHWIFHRRGTWGSTDKEETLLTTVTSGAGAYLGRSRDVILEEMRTEVERLVPEAKDAKLKKEWLIMEKHATFLPVPGVESLRPAQKTPIEGLYLAGAWTKTGWPSTMESAVRSGELAARALLEGLGMPSEGADTLPPLHESPA